MSTTKPLTGPLLKSGGRDVSRGQDAIVSAFNRYGIKKYAVLVDHTTVMDDLPELGDYALNGFYTFDINMDEVLLDGHRINLIRADKPLPGCDGWLVASTSRAAAVNLNAALMKCGQERQIVVRLYAGQITAMSAYMDFFSGETETLIYINHYFNRKYRINVPIDVRYMICDFDGRIRFSGQRIIPPGGITVVDSRDFNLGSFRGYLRVELEVENFQVRVQPFIHFWADYVSESGLCRNHQSGWAPWPAETIFNRGYLPLDPKQEASVSIYNDNDCAVQPNILLHYTQSGEEKKIERSLDAIPPKSMSFQNISELFEDLSFEAVKSAYFLMTCDQPLHRPNNYIHQKGTLQLTDTCHQTGGAACHWAIPAHNYHRRELQRQRQLKIEPWIVRFPILEDKYEIDTFLGLLSPTICSISDFTAELWNESGELVYSEDITLNGDSHQYLNWNQFFADKGVTVRSGMVCLKARRELTEVPRTLVVLVGFKHRKYPSISTSFMEGQKHMSLPFYITPRRPLSREYDRCFLQTSDSFAPGIISDEYDSLYVIPNCASLEGYQVGSDYQLEIIDEKGKVVVLNRSIPASGHDAFWLSQVLKEAGVSHSQTTYYTLWVKCYDKLLNGFHFLYRKRDNALSCDDISEGTLQREPQIAGILDAQEQR